MAHTFEHHGETGLQVSLEFPDAKSCADFEVAFRGWATQYQQAVSTRQLVAALAAKEAGGTGGDDTAGYLMRVLDGKGGGWYLDLI